MKRISSAVAPGSQVAKLAIGKRKRDSEAEPTPSKRSSRTTKPLPSTTPASSLDSLPPQPSTDFAQLKGFLPLPVRLHADSHPSSSASGSSPPARYLYYRPHHPTSSDEDADIPADRTLLVVNVPFYYTANELTELFSCFGEVETAVILSRSTQHSKPPLLLAPLDQSVYETAAVSSGLEVWQPDPPHPYYRSARVMFTSATSLTTATSLAHSIATSLQPHIPPASSQLFGLPLLLAHYRRQRPSVDALRESVNRFMAAFDAQEKERVQQQRDAAHNDGWTLVRSKRASSRSSSSSSEDERVERLELLKRKEEKKRAEVAGLGFYRFQGVEKKQGQLVELRRKFEEDKAKVAVMKANRKFKPL